MHVSAHAMASKLTTKMFTFMVCFFYTLFGGTLSQYHVPKAQEITYNAHQTKYAPEYNDYKPKNYQFEYGVSDPHTGDHKTHWETKENGIVYGMYSLLEPDGMTRVVEYTADRDNGFRAVVKKFPSANYHERADSRLPQSYSYHDVYYKKDDKQNSPIIHNVNRNENAKLQVAAERSRNSLEENDETDKEEPEVLPINKETENVDPKKHETENKHDDDEEEDSADINHEDERNEEEEDERNLHNLETNEDEEKEEDRNALNLPYNSNDYEDE